MAKRVLFKAEARERVLRGVIALADAVEVTLGPKSKCVLIEKRVAAPIVCNDDMTIAKETELFSVAVRSPFSLGGTALPGRARQRSRGDGRVGAQDAFVVKAEIPGVEQKDIQVSLQEQLLTVKGEKVTATFKDGVLTVALPKTPAAKGTRDHLQGGLTITRGGMGSYALLDGVAVAPLLDLLLDDWLFELIDLKERAGGDDMAGRDAGARPHDSRCRDDPAGTTRH